MESKILRALKLGGIMRTLVEIIRFQRDPNG